MSSKVKLPGGVTPRFPLQCVCCLAPAAERRGATWSLYKLAPVATSGITLHTSTVAISGIPYCREHAADHDAWVAWTNDREDALTMPFSRLTFAKYLFSPSGALAILGAIIAVAAGSDPLLGIALGLAAGGIVGLTLFFRHLQRKATPPKPTVPRVEGGTKIVHYSPAMGLDLGAKVDVVHISRFSQDVSIQIKELVLNFDNLEYARLFAAENGVKA